MTRTHQLLVKDLKPFLQSKGYATSGKKKDELLKQASDWFMKQVTPV